MHSLRQLSILVLVLAASSCSDATEPKRVSDSQFYLLTTVDGQSLPAVTIDIAGTLSETTVWGELDLYSNGSAVVTNHIVRVDRMTDTTAYDQTDSVAYRIHGDSIEVGSFGLCHGICPPNLVGTVSESNVTLVPEQFGAPVFQYIGVRHDAPN